VKITFLGTGTSQGVPVIACECSVCASTDSRDKRLRTSLLLEIENTTLLFDAGPDFRQQMLRENVTKLDAILLTHEHKDHIAGLDDVRAFNHKSRSAIDIYSEARVQKAIRNEYSYVFSEIKYPGIPKMRLCTISDNAFLINNVEILPIRAYHHRLPVYGFRVGNFAYITDANHLPEESKEELAGIKYFVINVLRKEKHISHFCLHEALELIKELLPEKTFFTHIGHQMGFHTDVSKELPQGVYLAYDGLSVEIN
jgi:phosphoribosyl 1,2-cyclic phosphate phosphodiesterase